MRGLQLLNLPLAPLRSLSLLLQHFAEAIQLLAILGAVREGLSELHPRLVDVVVHSARRANAIEVFRSATD